jgi:hypothetical protein
MSDVMRDLVRPVGDFEPPMDLLIRINERERALPEHRARLALPSSMRWILAAAGVALVLGALALAAHSRSNSPTPVAVGPLASSAKLRILRESFANPQSHHRAGSIAEVARRLPIALVRPDAPLASDATIDSVWLGDSGGHSVVVIWKSGVVETITRWRCNCEAVAALKQLGHEKPFRFMMLGGAPALIAPSNPAQRVRFGLVSRDTDAYGVPASVETIRDGYNVTFYRYGADALPGLLAAMSTLPPQPRVFEFYGSQAGGAALGNWDGAHGIDVAPQGGARFGIGVALKSVTGHPLTITGVNAINGFIRLVGTHVRAYTPPVGGLVGPSIIQPPYDDTSLTLSYELQPNTWAGLQLDFQIQNPCIPWSQTIYDRTVEVTYTQDGRAHIQEVPLVPLNITRAHPC